MRCPITTTHLMVEIAPGCHQCPHCGLGGLGAFFPTWALSNVEVVEGVQGYALCVTFRASTEKYSLSELEWAVNDEGSRVGKISQEILIDELSEEDEAQFALPVVIRAEDKWSIDPLSILSAGMYERAEGQKRIDL